MRKPQAPADGSALRGATTPRTGPVTLPPARGGSARRPPLRRGWGRGREGEGREGGGRWAVKQPILTSQAQARESERWATPGSEPSIRGSPGSVGCLPPPPEAVSGAAPPLTAGRAPSHSPQAATLADRGPARGICSLEVGLGWQPRPRGRGAGLSYLHFPPPSRVLPVMGRHLAC